MASVHHEKHLGNLIVCDINDKYIDANVCDFYQRSHSIINAFRACDSDTLDRLHRTFCMHMYGCELWDLSHKSINAFRVAWRKIKRRIWKLSYRAHNHIVHDLSYNFDEILEMKLLTFIHITP